ncbi:magnesium/cobalt transporter CorA [Oculatella sp. FACHB-28]|uniref:magnesium/cobalt transporter CorA n=1 Tax=Oculatella sp. FACHB-28 TaxID=2692845 RepID=UPI0016864747|nr:magnesium/cobalt transporter CorA [Oculatella sp. FACHB-28]MBD2058620.1 magnesium/cobalt transporter CorA [Oculatella sp. FACHB-28]
MQAQPPRSSSSNRPRFFNERRGVPGDVHFHPDAPPPKITLIDYSRSEVKKVDINKPEECIPYLDSESVSWVDVSGLGDEQTWQQIKQVFNLHPLALEDIIHVPQRPHMQEYEEQLVLIARMVSLREDGRSVMTEQISLVLGKHYLLTVQEEPYYDCLGFVREQIQLGRSLIRKAGADYLLYTLIDAIIDGFYPILEMYGELIEDLEAEVVSVPTPHTLEEIYQIKRELLELRRAIWPQRDAINALIRDSSDLISQDVRTFLRDCYDHAVQVLDIVETYRELAASLTDVYLSSVSNRMNEVMKLLTIISSIFIPLTFIAGIYGMNFNTETSPFNMPELNWYWGYVATLAVMAVIAVGMIIFFWRKGWFENFTGIRNDRRSSPKRKRKWLK